jgi:hypothetical protein
VLTVIVAIVAISIGIKDYVDQRKEAKLPANTSESTSVPSNATTHRKSNSGKIKLARMSTTEKMSPGTAKSTTDNPVTNNNEVEKRLNSGEFATMGVKAIPVADNTPGTVRGRANRDGVEAALSEGQCLPLPNLTKPEDVDGKYYMNWAKEYCGGSD